MTKQDFELIANVIKDQRNLSLIPGYGDPTPKMIACAFADRLAKTNPRFDRVAFLRACGTGAYS